MAGVVLVHGNPETAAIWDPLRSVLGRPDVKTLSPPGFGAPVPPGFGATTDDYLAWLIAELERESDPVDLVGHDWGGGHVIRVALDRPDLIRSWVTDIAGCLAPDYEWHEMAQLWQTAGGGEDAIAALLATPVADRATVYESLGMTPEVAHQVAEGFDEAMGRCILALYRSAAQPAMASLGQRLGDAAARRGLVVIPTEDSYTGGEQRARWSAEKACADVAVLPGLGHWWMLEDPRAGAEVVASFWSSLDERSG
jgi:pimeloyl-ACP methyl ester carboxylesterase